MLPVFISGANGSVACRTRPQKGRATMPTSPTDVEGDVVIAGRMITSRWRPNTLRTTPSREDRGLFGHPRGLPWMLNVEMWERFSYYGMRAILLYFIVDTVGNGGLGLSKNSGEVILAVYSAPSTCWPSPGAFSPIASSGHGCPPSTAGWSSWRATSACRSRRLPFPGSASSWSRWEPASSNRTCRRSSEACTTKTIPGATPDSSCSTCRSTSGRWPLP